MLSLLFGAALLGLFGLLYEIMGFIRNVRAAKTTGLPYTISPHLEFEKIAYITTPILRGVYSPRLLSSDGWPRWARFMIKDWQYEDQFRAHREFGEVFLVAAPHGLICYSADATMAMDVCTRRKEFTKPRDKYKLLEPFGPNVASAEGNLWRFHNRITAPPFGEANNGLVWNETIRQTELLTKVWVCNGSRELKHGISQLTLNIIAGAGFGKRLEWKDSDVSEGHRLTFLQAMTGVVEYMVTILLLPKWLLRRSPWRIAACSKDEFEFYVRELIGAEKKRIFENRTVKYSTRGNLLTAIIQSSADEAAASSAPMIKTAEKSYFSDDEVLGNAFIYLLAGKRRPHSSITSDADFDAVGFDTTANTMIYAALTLALHSDLQDRILDEIDQVYHQLAIEGKDTLDYQRDYVKFPNVLSFVLEILRIYPTVILITKMILNDTVIYHTTTNTTGPRRTGSPAKSPSASYRLPKNCRVYLSSPGVHLNPRNWIQPMTLDPLRFMSTSPNTWDPSLPPSHPHQPKLLTDASRIPLHTKGSFLTFSEGARACAGRKFALVELVAFFATVLRSARLRLREGEDAARVEKVLRARCAGSVTLSPVEVVKVLLVPRETGEKV